MTTMQFELPEPLRDFVHQQAAAGGYASPGDYVVAVLQRAARRAEIDAKLREGLAELQRGEGRPMTREDWDALHAEVRARHKDGDPP